MAATSVGMTMETMTPRITYTATRNSGALDGIMAQG
jgi:hypothetical protein